MCALLCARAQVLLFAALALTATPESSVAQGRETLETRVSVNGDRVTLEWSKKHPWDAVLLRSAPVLLAEYRTAGGQVVLDCLMGASDATARMRGAGCAGGQGIRDRGPQERSILYRLPLALAAVPVGNACLLFQMPDQHPLPLRRVNRDRDETARFRYPEWEALARSDVESATLRRQLEEARSSLAAKRSEVAAAEQRNAGKRWTTAPACAAMPAPNLSTEAGSRPVVEPREQELVARQVCVMRAGNAGDRFGNKPVLGRLQYGVLHPPSVLDSVMARIRQRHGAAAIVLSPDRQQQWEHYRRDWNQLAGQVTRYREGIRQAGYTEPHFGDFTDLLYLQGFAAQAGGTVGDSLAAGKLPPASYVNGWIGGSLEAYSRCVVDGQAQLATSYRAAEELEQRRPALQESARRTLVKACTDGVGQLEGLRAQLASLEAQVASAERAVADVRAPPTLTARAREVNADACVP